MLHRKLNRGNWQSICDASLIPYVLQSTSTQKHHWSIVSFMIAGILAIIAMAGPTWERLPSPAFRNESATVILLDLSRSMDAQDIKPSRLQRARFKIKDILDRRKDGQTALIVFAGDAFIVTPLTDDVETISNHLSGLETSLMPIQGDNIARALEEAESLFKQAGISTGHLLLVSDDSNHDNAIAKADRLAANGYQLSVLGVGTSGGAPIPQRQGGFVKDASGNIVVPKLDVAGLEKLADVGGGIFQLLTPDNRDINTLDRYLNRGTLKDGNRVMDLNIDQWEEVGPWLLLPVLIISAFVFRRGIVAMILLPFLLTPWQSTRAFEWRNLWQTPDQQASRAYQQGDAQKAAELFNDPKWKSAAQYTAGDYERSLESLGKFEDSDSHYNRGNALARLGRYQQALKAYEDALKKDPDNDDAKYNKNIVEKQLRQQQSKQSEQQQNQSDQKPDKDSNQQNSGDNESNSPPSENSDQSEADSQKRGEDQPNESAEQSPNADNQNHNKKPETEYQNDNQPTDNQFEESEKSEMNQNPTPDDMQANEKQSQSLSSQPEDENSSDESKQAVEQWLRRIPDDPGKLLRQKFRFQHQQRQQRGQSRITRQW